jgi:hypothetical protein
MRATELSTVSPSLPGSTGGSEQSIPCYNKRTKMRNETVHHEISLPQDTVAMVLFRTVLHVSGYRDLLSSVKRCYHGGAQNVFIKLKLNILESQ